MTSRSAWRTLRHIARGCRVTPPPKACPNSMTGSIHISSAAAPGSKYAYSNAGYALLGDILARLSGTDYGTLEYESISLPLGLTDTRETLTDEQTGRLAQGYTSSGSPAGYFPSSGAMSGAGYLRSTLNDMTRFLIANMKLNSGALARSIALAQTVQAEGSDAATRNRTGLGDRPAWRQRRATLEGRGDWLALQVTFLSGAMAARALYF